MSTLQSQQKPSKKPRLNTELVPVVFGILKDKPGKVSSAPVIKILLDSGASSTLIIERFVQNLKLKKNTKTTKCRTTAGVFETNKLVDLQFILPELYEGRTICATAHITKQLGQYDMILGRDILRELGIVIDFKEETIIWD